MKSFLPIQKSAKHINNEMARFPQVTCKLISKMKSNIKWWWSNLADTTAAKPSDNYSEGYCKVFSRWKRLHYKLLTMLYYQQQRTLVPTLAITSLAIISELQHSFHILRTYQLTKGRYDVFLQSLLRVFYSLHSHLNCHLLLQFIASIINVNWI